MKKGIVGVLFLALLVPALFAVGGEDCNSATTVPSLPFWDETTTEGFANDYPLDPSWCTGNTTLGPDAVYKYTVPYAGDTQCVMLTVIIPQDFWNVSIYVMEDDCSDPQVTCIAGADQYGPGSPEAIVDLTLIGGHTYYFVVDGRESGDYGPYKIGLSDCVVGLDESFYNEIGRPTFTVSPTIVGENAVISYDLKKEETGRISVLDASGRTIRVIKSGILTGSFSLVWNLENSSGKRVNPGVYFVKFQAGDYSKTQRVIVVH